LCFGFHKRDGPTQKRNRLSNEKKKTAVRGGVDRPSKKRRKKARLQKKKRGEGGREQSSTPRGKKTGGREGLLQKITRGGGSPTWGGGTRERRNLRQTPGGGAGTIILGVSEGTPKTKKTGGLCRKLPNLGKNQKGGGEGRGQQRGETKHIV